MTLFEDDPLVNSPDSGILQSPGQDAPGIGLSPEAGQIPIPADAGMVPDLSGGIGLAPAVKAPTPRDEMKAAIERMSGPQKFLSAIGEFGAGVLGKQSPLALQVEEQRKARTLQIAETKGHIDALESGAKIAKTLQGPGKESFIKDYAEQLNAMRPGLGDTFSHVAAQPDLLDNFERYFPNLPESMKALAKTNPDAFWKVASSPEGLKEMQAANDRVHTDFATRKATGMIGTLQQLGLPEDMVKSFLERPTATGFNKLQDALPAGHPMKLSDTQRKAVAGNPELFYAGIGVMSPKTEQEVLKDDAKGDNKNVRLEWVGRPGGMKQQARIDRDGNILGFVGEPVAAHAAPVNVYNGSMQSGVDAQGNPVFVQGSGRADVPPRVVEGVFPPEKADQRKTRTKEDEAAKGFQSIDRQITELEKLVTSTEGKFTSATGLKGLATRVTETATGMVNPDAATPALDAKNRKELLVAGLRKQMADTNMSKRDKDALETAIGGIESSWGTKASTLRALGNLRGFLRDKLPAESKPKGGAADKFEVGKTYEDANGNKAKYLGNGKWE